MADYGRISFAPPRRSGSILVQSPRARLKARIDSTNESLTWLKTWDKGSEKARKRALRAMLCEFEQKSPAEIRERTTANASLLLARLLCSLRLTYAVRFEIAVHAKLIRALLKAHPRGNILEEFLLSGVIATLLEVVKMEATFDGVMEDICSVLELLFEVVQQSSKAKKTVIEFNCFKALTVCLSTAKSREVQVAAKDLLVALGSGLGTSELSAACSKQLATLIRSEFRATQLVVCSAIHELVDKQTSCFSGGANDKQRYAMLIQPAVSMSLQPDLKIQESGTALARSLLAKDDLFGVLTAALIAGLQKLPARTSESELEMPDYGVTCVLSELVLSSSTSKLSTLCFNGIGNAFAAGMLNIHHYEIQKVAIESLRNLCHRYEPAFEDMRELLGEKFCIRVVASTSLFDGQVIKELISDEALFNTIVGKLRLRGWFASMRNGDQSEASKLEKGQDGSSSPAAKLEEANDGIADMYFSEEDAENFLETGDKETPEEDEDEVSISNVLLPSQEEAKLLPPRLRLPLTEEQLQARAEARWNHAQQKERKQEVYVPKHVADPSKVPTSIMFVQAIQMGKQILHDEDEQTLEYIRGVPATEESKEAPLANAIVPTGDILETVHTESLQIIPARFLPGNLGKTNETGGAKSKSLDAGKKGKRGNKEKEKSKSTLDKERRKLERKKRGDEIRRNKQIIREERARREEQARLKKSEEQDQFYHDDFMFSQDALVQMAIKRNDEIQEQFHKEAESREIAKMQATPVEVKEQPRKQEQKPPPIQSVHPKPSSGPASPKGTKKAKGKRRKKKG